LKIWKIMKNYLSTKKGSSRQRFLPRNIKILAIVLIVMLLSYYLVPRALSLVVATVLYPIESTRVWLSESSGSLPSYLRERTILLQELEDLKQTVATNESSEFTIAKLQAENEQFRSMLEAVPEDRIVARVVGRPADLPYDVLMLDRGRAQGIVESAPVFVGSDQVIGYVARVYEHTSLVTLVTTAGFEATAYIIGPNIYTFAEGIGGGMMRVRVPQGITLRAGDPVILPAIDSGVYGAVAEVVSSPTQPEQFGYVPLSVGLQSLQYVSVARQPLVRHTYEEAEKLVEELKRELFVVDLPPGVLVTPELATTTATTSTASTTRP
jgi:cell shape-determining protein MreC